MLNQKESDLIRAIAFYLPQFHPIPENDNWWGTGFTEWTNVTKAKPLFKNHKQPNLPSDLGFYDLRLAKTRQQQTELAKNYGIEGFCYWHYWFGNGKRILERPFNEVLNTKEPDFPFCLAWANESWTGIWHGMDHKVLMEQTYPGEDDDTNHFYQILPAFKDERYIKINKKPIFLVYRPHKHPRPAQFISLWRNLAKKEGLEGIHFIGVDEQKSCLEYGFDGTVPNSPTPILEKFRDPIFFRIIQKLTSINIKNTYRKFKGLPNMFSYQKFVELSPNHPLNINEYPVILPGWDNTPRSHKNGLILLNSNPVLFEKLVTKAIKQVIEKPYEERLVFIKSWNEWAEGNIMEPNQFYGHGYLQAFKNAILKFIK
jgi:lipopolysaccharide biosynthesis protein